VGRDYWACYRKLYHQELYAFGQTFTDIFVKKPFLEALVKALRGA
jgi:hypothetical protein